MAQIRMRENRLNGLFPLSYVGVIPVAPQNFIMATAAPTSADAKNFYIGDLWLDYSSDTAANGYVKPTINNLWILVSLDGGVATWINFGGSGVIVETLTGNSGGAVGPLGNNINTVGDGVGITVVGNPGTHTLTWSLVGGGVAAQSFPTDSGTATPNASGVLNIITSQSTNAAGITTLFTGSGNTVQFKNTDANGNVNFGKSSGKSGQSGSRNSAFGQSTLSAITTGSDNTAIGFAALNAITTPSDNTAVGSSALLNLVTGSNNIAIGFDAGDSYTGAEANNIVIGNTGVIAENNTIRVGTTGGGAGQQNRFFAAGVDGVNVGNNTVKVVSMGTAGTAEQLGTVNIVGGTNVTVVPTANTITINATGGVSQSITSGASVTWGTTAGHIYVNFFAGGGGTTAAIEAQSVAATGGIFSKLYVNAFSNGSTTDNTITLNVNGALTALTTTIPATMTNIYSDLTHSVSVNAGDLICWQISVSTTSPTVANVTCLFTTV